MIGGRSKLLLLVALFAWHVLGANALERGGQLPDSIVVNGVRYLRTKGSSTKKDSPTAAPSTDIPVAGAGADFPTLGPS